MDLIGTGLRRFLSSTDLPPFKPRFPWIGGDLQTLRNSFVSTPETLVPDERILAPIDVGAINIAVNHPGENHQGENHLEHGASLNRSLVLVHGLGGGEDSSYMVSAARRFLNCGYSVYRMNYRGVGPSAETSEGPYSAGLTSDLRAVLRRVGKHQPDSTLYLMGFSLGGQLSLRMLGEGDVPGKVPGNLSGNLPGGVAACVTVSAPLDLATSQKKLERRRNHFYSRYVVNNMKNDLAGLSHPKVNVDPKILTSVWDFDQYIIAPVFGFKSAADYYARASCFPLLDRIDIPTLAVHAADDPWIPVEDYHRAAWPDNAPAGAVITPSGGHVGFHAGGDHRPWHEQTALHFFDCCAANK